MNRTAKFSPSPTDNKQAGKRERPVQVQRGYPKLTTKLQVLIVLLLGAAVFGGGGYFIYDALHPYRFLSKQKPRRWVPPIVGATAHAKQLRAEGKLSEAQQLLRTQLRLYARRPEAKAARELLGEINTEMFFSTEFPYGKTEYVVKRGDSLWRIARKFDSSPEIIQRTNKLESTRLHPGDQLWVPTAEFTITLDLPNERVVVHTGNEFFKQYPIVGMNLPSPIRAPITTRITGVTFWRDGTRVAAPANDNDATTVPWLHLGKHDYILYGVSEDEGVNDNAVEIYDPSRSEGEPAPPPRGFALHSEDLVELRLLIDRGTPVTIIGQEK